MKPNKQRKAHFNAPLHEKRKRISARLQLDKPDARFDGVRTVTVRVGDTVRVIRGDFQWWKATRWKAERRPTNGSVHPNRF